MIRRAAWLATILVAIACAEEPATPEVGPVRIVSFEVTPAVVHPFEEVEVSWGTEHATMVSLFAGEEIVALEESSGTRRQTLHVTTVFRLVAEGAVGRIESEPITVVVDEFEEDPLEIVSFRAEPPAILPGGRTSLVWTTRGADGIRILDAGGVPLDTGDEAAESGAVGVEPSSSTSYTLIAYRGKESKEAHASVVVSPLPLPKIVSFRPTDGGPKAVGSMVRLEWEVEDAQSLLLSNLEGEEASLSAVESSGEIPMGREGRFRLVAIGGEVETFAETTVPILAPPAIEKFWANPWLATLPAGEVTLHWSGVARAESLEIIADPPVSVDLGGRDLAKDSVSATIAEETTFRLVARNAAGEAEATTSAQMIPGPRIVRFEAIPSEVVPGEPFVLTWETEDANSISLVDDEGGLPEVRDGMLSATIEKTVAEDTEYVLRAYNRAGAWVEERQKVTIVAP